MWPLARLPNASCATIKNATGCNTAYETHYRVSRAQASLWPWPMLIGYRCVWTVHWGSAQCTPESDVGYPPCPTPPALPEPSAPPAPISPRPSNPPHLPPPEIPSPSQPPWPGPPPAPAQSWHGLSLPLTIAVAVTVALLSCTLVAFIWHYSMTRRRLAQLAREKQRVNYELNMAMSVATPRAALLDDHPRATPRCCAARLDEGPSSSGEGPLVVLRPPPLQPLEPSTFYDRPFITTSRLADNLASRGNALASALPLATRARTLPAGEGGRGGEGPRLLWDSDSPTSSTSGRRSTPSDASAEDPSARHQQREIGSVSPIRYPLPHRHSCGSPNHRSPGSSEVSTALATQREGDATASWAAPSTAARDPPSRDPPPVLHRRALTNDLTVSELLSAMRSHSVPPSSSLNEEINALTQ